MTEGSRAKSDAENSVKRGPAKPLFDRRINSETDIGEIPPVNFGRRRADFVIDLAEGSSSRAVLRQTHHHPPTLPRRIGLRCVRRALDVATALVALAITAPVFIAVALAAKCSTRGPVFFTQERVGRNGHLFTCLKFRSMYPDADDRLVELLSHDDEFRTQWLEMQKAENDPRITPIGRWLRKTSLDELPQLINVLRGEMSIVGPRPIVPEETERYGDAMPIVLRVRPGLTGLWQVSGRNALPYADRIALDLRYVNEQSLALDAKILARTITTVITGDGAH